MLVATRCPVILRVSNPATRASSTSALFACSSSRVRPVRGRLPSPNTVRSLRGPVPLAAVVGERERRGAPGRPRRKLDGHRLADAAIDRQGGAGAPSPAPHFRSYSLVREPLIVTPSSRRPRSASARGFAARSPRSLRCSRAPAHQKDLGAGVLARSRAISGDHRARSGPQDPWRDLIHDCPRQPAVGK